MLEAINLCKTYMPRKSKRIVAVNNISLKFKDTGMVFILGKSGSGKSTLLNLLGGLDKYDGGDILIKGVSTKKFKQKQFDSYRNTLIGFVFQDYNLLEEFNVGANIALAIQLQNRKATDREVSSILSEVGLEGYGSRNPNELSGGEKQKVAIARALVKKPEIIMADEPTGALDSVSGKQVMNTLKKLSYSKLVIVVTHDRNAAEEYGDRIIELEDGQVLSDIENTGDYIVPGGKQSGEITFKKGTISIPDGYHLTDSDRKAINAYIDGLKNGIDISISKADTNSKKDASKEENYQNNKEEDKPFKLMKYDLHLKNSLLIAVNGLKHKKARLIFGILLSFVSFTLFGLSDAFACYNNIRTCANSILDSGITCASVTKNMKIQDTGEYYWSSWSYRLTDEELQKFCQDTGYTFKGVYVPSFSMDFSANYNSSVQLAQGDYSLYPYCFSGFAEVSQDDLSSMNYRLLAGRLPMGDKDEIAISELVYETFAKAGYCSKKIEDSNEESISINCYEDMIGKTLALGNRQYAVTGIIDTGFDINYYQKLINENDTLYSDSITDYLLTNELYYYKSYSYTGTAMVGEGYINKLVDTQPKFYDFPDVYLWYFNDDYSIDGEYVARLSDIDKSKIIWVDGEKDTLSDNEVIVTSDCLGPYGYGSVDIGEAFSKDNYYTLYEYDYLTSNDESNVDSNTWKVVGYIDNSSYKDGLFRTFVLPDDMINRFISGREGVYNYALTAMPASQDEVERIISYFGRAGDSTRYELENPVSYQLSMINIILKKLSKIFFYVGVVLAVLAAMTLTSFIMNSISYKKHEVGILRAMGATGRDVFWIFFGEGMIIALISFALSCIGCFTATSLMNLYIRNQIGVLITIISFGIRQVGMIFAISIGVTAVASFLPFRKIAAMSPIDIIRNK